MEHLSPEQLAELRQRLESERVQFHDRQVSEEATATPEQEVGDNLDKATEEARRTMAQHRHHHHEARRAEVEAALSRMDAGTYGICEETDEPIPWGRLQAEPTTRYTVEALEMLEQERARDGVSGHDHDDREAY